MAFYLSPIIDVNEIDLTLGVPAVSTSIGAFAGPFVWGPVEEIVTIASETELAARFGKPDNDTAASWFSAANFLAYSNNLKTVRVVGSLAVNAGSSGTGVLIKNETDYENKIDGIVLDGSEFFAKYPGSLGNGLQVYAQNSANYSSWTFADAFDSAPAANEIHLVVVDGDGTWTGIAGNILEKFAFLSTVAGTQSSDGSNVYYKDVITQQSRYIWVGGGADETAFTNASQTNSISSESTVVAALDPSVVALTTDISGTDLLYVTFDSGSGPVELVEGVDYTKTINASPTPDELDFTLLNGGATFPVGGTIAVVVTPATITTTAPFDADDTLVVTIGTSTLVEGTEYSRTAPNMINMLLPLEVAGTLTIKNEFFAELSGGVDDNIGVDITDGYEMFRNAEEVDISLVVTGPATQVQAEWVLDNIGEYRKDCVVFISPEKSDVVNNPGDEVADTVAFRNQFNSSSYGFMDNNWKKQYDRYNDTFRWVPLNGDIAGLAAYTDNVSDPWYSIAGFNRGLVKNVVKLAYSPNQTQRDELYKNGVNPVVNFSGQGTVLYGDKTMLSRPSAFDRINVRRLFIVLEKAIATAAKYQLFEFNDEFTRAQFKNMVEPFLRDVQGRRGIYDFRVVADTTNNTPEVIDRNEFVGDIYIKPARSINFIRLNFIAVRTGVSFEEVGA
ncbi:MAG: hypothetical protein BV459_00350 [Thermoplasmata archaeon M11B2D]|nr:MAG: hypothetical protein BV459_00350 [Thermoplasmata archaeon M11B2D]